MMRRRLSFNHQAGVVCLVGLATALLLSLGRDAIAASWMQPPPLPAPSGNVVTVSTEPALRAAIQNLASNTTIVISPGTYTLTSTLYIGGSLTNVAVRGATNNREDVVLVGRGMSNSSYGAVPHGIWTGNGVNGVTIANLTIRDVYYHPVIFNAGTESPRLYNVRLLDAGEQFVKANPDGAGGGVDNGIVEYSVLEYTTTARGYYTNGVDVHTGQNWIVRHNLFRRIRAPQGQLAGPAILMWNSSSGSVAEGNTFVDCQREISFGLIEKTPNDHSGGVVRNNFITRATGMGGDVAIAVFDSPGTRVVHNSMLLNGQYGSPIEYRFPNTSGVLIVNNLLDGVVQARDGAGATVQGNVTSASASMFVAPTGGDLHLRDSATVATLWRRPRRGSRRVHRQRDDAPGCPTQSARHHRQLIVCDRSSCPHDVCWP
jgi:hypothetical protein